jgi:protein SCO1/2
LRRIADSISTAEIAEIAEGKRFFYSVLCALCVLCGLSFIPQSAIRNPKVPDVVLVNQHGERVRFRDMVKNNVVAINFIFTTCTTICPPMGANFAKLQKLMGDRVGRDVRLISISVDPATDTPERLKAWSEQFAAGPGWTLLTGPRPDVVKLLKALQVFTADKWDHAPVVLIGSEVTGHWARANGLAAPSELMDIITAAIDAAAKKSSSREVGQ